MDQITRIFIYISVIHIFFLIFSIGYAIAVTVAYTVFLNQYKPWRMKDQKLAVAKTGIVLLAMGAVYLPYAMIF